MFPGGAEPEETPVDVGAWLRELDLEQYEAAFRANDVDAEILPTLTADELKDIGVSSIRHRRRLLEARRTQVVVATPFERKLRWRFESDGRIGLGGRPYSHLVGRWLQDAMSGGGSGWRLRPVWRVRMPRSRQVCRRR